ncbi:MAG: hypothetical protein Q8K55_02535 [Gemmatimonadaceae bacterium]|nr:hypothetical protein [Gemmatimonadaceae bacterium]
MPRCAAAAFLLFAVSLNAQSAPDATTARPERPTVATHAVAMAPGHLEFEAGAATTRLAGVADHTMILTTKFGLANRLQLTVASSVTRTAARVTSADPIYAGVKWQAGALRTGRPLFAVMPGVTFANGPRRDRDAAFSLMAVYSQSFGPVAVDLNAAATRLNRVEGRMPHLWAAAVGGPVAGALGWGVEWWGASDDDAPASTNVLGFLGYTVRPWLVLDAGFTTPVEGEAGTTLFTGLTWNLGPVARR